ncbi:MAG: hypothetical protein SVM86_00825 [Candidatus Cloacimonadota bacterium]|nr:hypothetical protein [Candidatus Cloacimonadota bacterium]
MKKSFSIILLVIIVMSTNNLIAETKLKMEIWNRWTYHQIDGDVTQNEMAVKRGYFRLEPQLTNNVKGRFNLDFFSDNGSPNGAGLKMKYAYLDFANLLPLKDSKLTIGLMKTYFGTIYDWSYPTIDKDPSDKYKFVSSTDYGMGVSGYFPQGYGTYAVAVYNGEGYKKTSGDINTDMNYLANIRVSPITGITLGGSYMFKSKNDSQATDREEYNMIAGLGKFAYGQATISAQYLTKTTSYPNDTLSDVTTSVVSIMPIYKINSKIELVARYDMYDPDTDVDDDGYNTAIGGLNYYLARDSKNSPKLMLQANYQMKTYEDDNSDDESTMMLQLRWIFSGKIK